MKHLVSAAGFLGLCLAVSPVAFAYADRAPISDVVAWLILPIVAMPPVLIWHFLIGRNVIYAYFEADDVTVPAKPRAALQLTSSKTQPAPVLVEVMPPARSAVDG